MGGGMAGSDKALAGHARRQHGVFSREQAKGAGFSESSIQRRLDAEGWVEVLPSVYCFASTPKTRMLELSAACLWSGPEGALARETAAEVYRLDGRWPAKAIHVITPMSRRLRTDETHAHIEVHRSRTYVPERDARRREGLQVTSLARTIIDLSPTLSEKWLEIALESALRDRQLDLGWVYRLIRKIGGKGQRGLPKLVRMLDERDGDRQRYQSALEVLIGRMQREFGLPEPIRQYTIVEANTRLLDADFAYPDLKVAIEGDGKMHMGKRGWARDATTRRKLKVHGWEVIGVTWSEVEKDPAAVARDISDIVCARARKRERLREKWARGAETSTASNASHPAARRVSRARSA